jgi:hypothetical protein
VLVLGRVTAFHIAQWWVRLDDALVAKVLQSHLVLCSARTIQPTFAKGQSAKVFIDDAHQLLGRLQPKRDNRKNGFLVKKELDTQ